MKQIVHLNLKVRGSSGLSLFSLQYEQGSILCEYTMPKITEKDRECALKFFETFQVEGQPITNPLFLKAGRKLSLDYSHYCFVVNNAYGYKGTKQKEAIAVSQWGTEVLIRAAHFLGKLECAARDGKELDQVLVQFFQDAVDNTESLMRKIEDIQAQ